MSAMPSHRSKPTTATRRGPRGGAAVAVLAVLGLLAAACGGSDASTDGGASKGKTVPLGTPMSSKEAADLAVQLLGPIKYVTGSTTRGVNGKVITIGGVAEIKDATGQDNYQGVCDGAKARFERANREGGVNGYTFDYVGCADTGGSPEAAKQKVREMVEKKKVFALIPKTVPSGGSATYLNTRKVPYFGWGIDGDYCGWNDRQFAFSTTGAIACSNVVRGKTFFSGVGITTYVEGTKQDPKKVKFAIVGSNDAAAAGAVPALANIAKGTGSEVVYSGKPIPGQGSPPLADYTPLAQEIVAAKPTAVYMPIPASPIFALIAALRANGYKGDVVMPFADARLMAVVNQIDQAYAETPNMGSLAFPSTEFAQVTKDLKAVGSKAPADGLGSVSSYIGADLFIAALEKVKGPLTTEALAKALNSGLSYPGYGNVACGTIWPGAHVVSSTCGALVQFDAKTKSIRPLADFREVGENYLFKAN